MFRAAPLGVGCDCEGVSGVVAESGDGARCDVGGGGYAASAVGV